MTEVAVPCHATAESVKPEIRPATPGGRELIAVDHFEEISFPHDTITTEAAQQANRKELTERVVERLKPTKTLTTSGNSDGQ